MKVKLIFYIFCFTVLFSSLKIYSSPSLISPIDLKEAFLEEAPLLDNYLEFFGWPWWSSEGSENEDELDQEKPFNFFSAENIQGLEKKLKDRIVGQDHAIEATVEALERYANGLNDSLTPVGCLMYVGPTGVGKTQLAKELAKNLFGHEQKMIRLNMAEYGDHSSLFRLLGSPPGYVHHEQGGVLTEALKNNPQAIILIDEFEKAYPSVLKVFLGLFEEGVITDSDNNLIDCRNSLFIVTTNLAEQTILTMHDLGKSNAEILEAIQPTLTQGLSPELYNRLEPVIFRGLKENVRDDLIKSLLTQVTEELIEKKQMRITFDQSVVHFVKKQASNYLLGARPFKQWIKQTVMNAITLALKQKYLQHNESAHVCYQDNDFIIQNLKGGEAFIWHWNDKTPKNQIPFNFTQLLSLEDDLKQRILGQPYAIKMTVAALMRYAAGLNGENCPLGAFLYAGPTGVGKTQLAKELAAQLFGSASHLIRLDMSEYTESHSITRLIGAPPGYLGHEKGGQLTEALKQHPFAVVLLDEVEKAHLNVLKALLSVLDEGYILDAKGERIDCRHVIFILTTNLGASQILSLQERGYQEEEILDAIQPHLIKFLSPELYNRLEVATFMGLNTDSLERLIENMLNEVKIQIQATKKIQITFDPSIIEFLKLNGYDYELGARPLKRLIQKTIVTSIAKKIVSGDVQIGDSITITYHNQEMVIEKN